MSENAKLVITAMAFFTFGLIVTLIPQYARDKEMRELEDRIEQVEKRGISICKGCGAEYYTDGFITYHDECPQCPMTEEQLDDWIKELENAKCKVCFDKKKIINQDGTERPCLECTK